MVFEVVVFMCLCLIALPTSLGIIHSVKVNESITLVPCPIPKVMELLKSRWDWYRDKELITPNTSEYLKLRQHNGSLTVTVRIDDFGHVYGCQGFAILRNETEINGEFLYHIISPIIPAFLEHNLKNENVAWGEMYHIPCNAGGIQSTLEIKVNGEISRKKRLTIFNDTLIECRAFNTAGEEKASAFLSVKPGTQDEGRLNFNGDRSKCEPFAVLAPSVCTNILRDENPEGGVYAISSSRLLRLERTNELLNLAFRQWDLLVQSDASSDSPRLRCLQQAKRLICLLVFPRCLEIESYVEDDAFDLDPEKRFLSPHEFPVCQQHCLLITALLCAASFNASQEVAALWNYKPNATQGDGWREMLARGGEIAQLLPNGGCASLPRMVTTNPLGSPRKSVLNQLDVSLPACQALSFAALSTHSVATLDAPQNCYTGRGVDYRGKSAGLPSCLPWTELDYVMSESPDPLTSLSPSIIPPETLQPLPANHSVCRNPLGLFAKPFCVGPGTSGALTLFNCPFLVDCASVKPTPLTNHVNPLHQQQRQHLILISIIIATMCVFVVISMCLVSVYVIRTCRREKVKIWGEEEEEEHETRLGYLVARRVRLRESKRCGRYLLRCLYALQDVCGEDRGAHCCGCRGCCECIEVDKPNLTKATKEKRPDDEDEEAQRFKALLRQNYVPARPLTSPAALVHTDNLPHLTSVESSIAASSRPPILESTSTLHPERAPSTDGSSASYRHFAGPDSAHVHLESAFLLVSASQLIHPKLKRLSYSRKLLAEKRILAKSAFGHVVLARAPNFSLHKRVGLCDNDLPEVKDESYSPYVVVKTLDFGATPAAETSFFREAEILLELDHPNIVKVIGICIPLQPYSLIYEYMKDGDLNTFLHRTRDAMPCVPATSDLAVAATDCGEEKDDGSKEEAPDEGALPTSTLIRFALDVCEAMIYLSTKLYVHRDLATRSCLVNGNHVKLADFSMLRRLPHNHFTDLVDTDSEAPLAVRWLPLESILQGHFNIDTDVWSFGILLWELFTFGRLPYGNVEVAEVIKALTENRRLPRPQHCSPSVYRLMLRCWSPTRERRPSFREIKLTLLANLQQFETK